MCKYPSKDVILPVRNKKKERKRNPNYKADELIFVSIDCV